MITLMSTFNGTIKLWMKREKRHVDVSYDNVENGFEATFEPTIKELMGTGSIAWVQFHVLVAWLEATNDAQQLDESS